jgi:hypothetical protein
MVHTYSTYTTNHILVASSNASPLLNIFFSSEKTSFWIVFLFLILNMIYPPFSPKKGGHSDFLSVPVPTLLERPRAVKGFNDVRYNRSFKSYVIIGAEQKRLTLWLCFRYAIYMK